jgi:hypothetical protein
MKGKTDKTRALENSNITGKISRTQCWKIKYKMVYVTNEPKINFLKSGKKCNPVENLTN